MRTFKIVNSSGKIEMPRLMITADGKYKSLFVGDNIVLATVSFNNSDEELWNEAMENINAHTQMINKTIQ